MRKGFLLAAGLLMLSATQAKACGPVLPPAGPVVRTMLKGADLTCTKIDFAGKPWRGEGIIGGRIVQLPLRVATYPFFTGYVILDEGREKLRKRNER